MHARQQRCVRGGCPCALSHCVSPAHPAQEGSVVNFERSARVGDEIGGHNVSGHVHCTATISAVESTENNRRLTFTVSNPAFMKYILPKGYIAVDGCSLTIGEVSGNTFTVYLIPETIRVTVFGVKGVGDSVNIEIETQTQAIVDTTERVVVQYLERLKGQGVAGLAAPPA
jgi:riboflavin synthase